VTRPVLIDGYSGAGGAAMGYHLAGFEVVGVDKAPQPRYPFRFLRADLTTIGWPELVEFLGAVAVHVSPPCQWATAYRRRGDGVGDGYLNLIPDMRAALAPLGVATVIENVESARAHLVNPVRYCGSSFGLDVRRHRMFETNFSLTAPACDHSWQTPRFTPASNRTNLRRTVEVGVYRIPLAVQQRAMGIDWMRLDELSEAIPPAYTEHIGRQMLTHLRTEVAA